MASANWHSAAYEMAQKIGNEMAIRILKSTWAENMTVKEVNRFTEGMEEYTRNRIYGMEPTTTQEGE